MSLTEQIKEIIEVLPEGQLQIKKITEIVKDGQVIANQIHREVAEPGSDVSQKSEKVQAIAAATWTPEVIAAFQARSQQLGV